jgi:hypothetical protein
MGNRRRHFGEIMNVDTACLRPAGRFDKVARLDRRALPQHLLDRLSPKGWDGPR